MAVAEGVARSVIAGGRSRVPAPAVILIPAVMVALAMALPLVYLLVRSLGAGGEAWDLLFRARTVEVFVRTVGLIAVVTGASVAIAVPLAWLTVRTDLPLRRVWSVSTILPLAIPSYVGGLLVVVALGPRGMLQQLLEVLFGVERLPEVYGFPGAAFTLTLLSYPFVLLTVRSALMRMDPALEETSRGLGHGAWSTFVRITLPQLRPAIGAGGLLAALYTLSDFGAVSLLRYETFTWTIFLQYEGFNRGVAAVLSLMLVGVAAAILLLEAGTRGRSRYYRSTAGAVRPVRVTLLGGWRWPAFGFCGGVVLMALVLPLAILGYWVLRGISAGEPVAFLWGRALNSVYVSGLAAGVAVVAALPVALFAVRHPGRLSMLIERLSYIGFALPGIVVALALVFFGIAYAQTLYQTVGLLIFAYVVLFLPTALGAVRTSLLQVNPGLEEAARSLGRRPLRVLTTVTLPLVGPGILAGASLVFLVTLKELPATLLLSPTGFQTLATSIWTAASEAFFARAAAPSLLLIVVASVPTVWLLLRERKVGL